MMRSDGRCSRESHVGVETSSKDGLAISETNDSSTLQRALNMFEAQQHVLYVVRTGEAHRFPLACKRQCQKHDQPVRETQVSARSSPLYHSARRDGGFVWEG